MSQTPTPAELEAEFDCLTARAGVTVPADRRADSLAAFADLRSQLPLLHARRPHTSEPASMFRLTPKAGS
jgi:hypothetical protein